MTEGNINNVDLYNLIKNLSTEIKEQNENIKKQIQTQQNEITSELRSLKDSFDVECAELKNINKNLVEENTELKKRVNYLERKDKKNNLIIHGMEESDNENTIDLVKNLINNTLNIPLTIPEINNTYRLGFKSSDKSRPIILQLVSYIKKTEIYSKVQNLKNTGVYIRDDLTPSDREERKLLTEHLMEARSKNLSAKIKNHKLIVSGHAYSYQDLVQKNTEQPKRQPSNSAPETPTCLDPPTNISLLPSSSPNNSAKGAISKLTASTLSNPRKRKESSSNQIELRSSKVSK